MEQTAFSPAGSAWKTRWGHFFPEGLKIMLAGLMESMLPSSRIWSGLTTKISRCRQHPPQRRQIMPAELCHRLLYVAMGDNFKRNTPPQFHYPSPMGGVKAATKSDSSTRVRLNRFFRFFMQTAAAHPSSKLRGIMFQNQKFLILTERIKTMLCFTLLFDTSRL